MLDNKILIAFSSILVSFLMIFASPALGISMVAGSLGFMAYLIVKIFLITSKGAFTIKHHHTHEHQVHNHHYSSVTEGTQSEQEFPDGTVVRNQHVRKWEN